MKKISLTIFFIFLVLGCAPSASDSTEPGTPVAPAVALPSRPAGSENVLRRQLLNADDPRISYCEILDNKNETYSGFRDTSLQPLASLSKVITGSWALDQLGADYRFNSELNLRLVGEGQFDVYLKTNYDPIVNIEKLFYFISEMNQLGVKKIRNLVIDETTRIYLSVLSNPHIELSQVPISLNETIENLDLIFNSKNWGEKSKTARENILSWAKTNKKNVVIPENFSVASVSYKASRDINVAEYPIKKVLPSAPLFRYLKNLNVSSNNYLADALFAQLGGRKSFQVFQKKTLGLSSEDLIVYTGSGLPDEVSGTRLDNLGSCFAMVRTLAFFKNKVDGAGLNLGAVLLNPTEDDDGTLDRSGIYQNAVVLKTGRLFDVAAMNLAGFVATPRGSLSFVFLGHDFSSEEAAQIEDSRAQMLMNIFGEFKTKSAFTTIDYGPIFF